MNNPKHRKPGAHNPSEETPGGPNEVTESGGARQYESGRNPAMQAQQSDRQGSGKPTQQRPEDR